VSITEVGPDEELDEKVMLGVLEGKAVTSGKLSVRGARVHNLRNVDLEIPRDSLVVFTGLSGSGKSSLAFDTIFACLPTRASF
jgi:ABC-type bacteriocin/lantibiotic exporter with double-glycine peptidase domain